MNPPEETPQARATMSRLRFLELGSAAAVALFGAAACGRARRVVRGQRERTASDGREHRRGHRGFGLGRLHRRLL